MLNVNMSAWIIVEIEYINVRRNTTIFLILEENNYMFRPFSGWAIIRLRLEYRRKLIYVLHCGHHT
jgi:hypothetical protein